MACFHQSGVRLFHGESKVIKDPYKIVLKPVITEKSTWLKEKNREICFEVDPRANKIEIKRAVEQLFKVKIDRVRVQNKKGKLRRVGRNEGRKKDWKAGWMVSI